MSIKYQKDCNLLFNDQLINVNQEKQELLVSTLKQLADENKRLLKEKEHFEFERSQQQIESNILKQNFINLLSIAQYECSKSNLQSHDYVNEIIFNEFISQKYLLNRCRLQHVNLSVILKYDFLLNLVTNETYKQHELLNDSSKGNRSSSSTTDLAFDCRPFKGPKTPPTPNIKNNKSTKVTSKRYTDFNSDQLNEASVRSVDDMLFYLNKYKNEFAQYSQVINNNININQVKTDLTVESSIGSKFLRPKGGTDSRFYQNLIDKHKKSLEMIDKVCYPVKSENLFEQKGKNYKCLLDLNTEFHNKRHSYTDCSSVQSKSAENFMFVQHKDTVCNGNKDNSSVDAFKFKQKYISKKSILMDHQLNFAEVQSKLKSNLKLSNQEVKKEEENIQLNSNTLKTIDVDDFNFQSVTKEHFQNATELSNTFEEGEIVDSGDESNHKKKRIYKPPEKVKKKKESSIIVKSLAVENNKVKERSFDDKYFSNIKESHKTYKWTGRYDEKYRYREFRSRSKEKYDNFKNYQRKSSICMNFNNKRENRNRIRSKQSTRYSISPKRRIYYY